MYWYIWWLAAFGGIFGLSVFVGMSRPEGFARVGSVLPWLNPLTSRLGERFRRWKDDEEPLPFWLFDAAAFALLAFMVIDVSFWIALGAVMLIVLHNPALFDAIVYNWCKHINSVLVRFKIEPWTVMWSAEDAVERLETNKFLETPVSMLFSTHVMAVASIVIGISLLIGWWAGMALSVFGAACLLWEAFGGDNPLVEEPVSEETASQS